MKKFISEIVSPFFIGLLAMGIIWLIVLIGPISRTNTPSEAVETRQPIVQWTRRPSILDPFTGHTEGVSEVDLARLVPDPYVVFTEPVEIVSLKDEIDHYEFHVENILPGDFYVYVLACKSKGWPGNLEDSEDMFWSEVEKEGSIYRVYACWIGHENNLTGDTVVDICKMEK